MNAKDLAGVFDSVLVPSGFHRKRNAWRKGNDETIAIVDLQKSQYGGQYFVNLAIYVRALGDLNEPSEHHAHIRVRLASIAGDEAGPLSQALDLESAAKSEDRGIIIGSALSAIALPFLAEGGTIPGLQKLHRTGRLGAALVARTARDLLCPTIG